MDPDPLQSLLRRRSLGFILALGALICTALHGVASAGVNTWTTNGPATGAYVLALTIDPSNPATLYAAAGGGIFKSADGGGSWATVNNGLPSPTFVETLVIGASSPAAIYAGSVGVYKSVDGGGNWSAINTGLIHPLGFVPAVRALAVDPTNPSTVYAGTTNAGVFRSTDGGGSWRAVGMVNQSIETIAVDPSTPTTVYVGTLGGGIYRSGDAGANWTPINSGLPRSTVTVLALSIDPANPATIYAGASFDGVFKSTNGGTTWKPINGGLTDPDVWSLAIDPSTPATLYAGTSTFSAGREGGGVFRSTNGGGTWSAMNDGLPSVGVTALAVDPLLPARLYAGTQGAGVFEYQRLKPCVSGPTTLCLNGGRFEVMTRWATRDEQSGSGEAVALTGDTGYFTFFDPGNVEVLVKVLNGCSFNARFWTFAGGLTDVNVVMTVTDTQTGAVKNYTNPQGTAFQPIQDTDAFEACPSGTAILQRREPSGIVGEPLLPFTVIRSFDRDAVGSCVTDGTTLCLSDSRYKVRTQWSTRDGGSGVGQAISLTGDTGAFWFFSSNNVEVVIKVLNGCGVNSHYWTFAGGLTDVNVVMTVTDTQTGSVKAYTNPQGTPFQPIQDTSAFATCP